MRAARQLASIGRSNLVRPKLVARDGPLMNQSQRPGIVPFMGHRNVFGASDSDVDVEACIIEAAKILPTQQILDNFVHHNPLHCFEHMEFNEAISHVAKLELFMSPAARCTVLLGVDPRPRVNDALGDLCQAFLDKGAARWQLPHRDRGFLFFFANMEESGFVPWRKKARAMARRIREDFILVDGTQEEILEQDRDLAENYLREYLKRFQVPDKDWTNAFRAQMSELRGWCGMFYNMQTVPGEAPSDANVRVLDLLAVRSILMWSSLENIAKKAGKDTARPAEWLKGAPRMRVMDNSEETHASAIAFMDQSVGRRTQLEEEYKNTLMEAIGTREIPPPEKRRPKLQVWTCIDDREESFRRHLEEANPTNIETFGVAGFFGIPVNYTPMDGRATMTQAPVGNHPAYTMVEKSSDEALMKLRIERKKNLAQLGVLWESASFMPVISQISTALFAPVTLARLYLMSFAPITAQRIRDEWTSYYVPDAPVTFDIPFPPEQAATFVGTCLNDIGTRDRFAPVVIILGHGSQSYNNPFRSAYQCGACQGRDGAPNARLFARCANDPEIRKILAETHNIHIPDDTWFIGGIHNTTRDEVTYLDLDMLPEMHAARFAQANEIIQHACGKNAMERCERFLLDWPRTREEALDFVKRRATDFSEMRPELNHATNGGVVIGRRDLTKGRFLDRRSFLLSYDPFNDDDEGTSLQRILTPALVVCSGINLEYLFSTTNADLHGAGTKVPLNVVGNIGVLQGVMGDLRPGLPTQMTEMHTPIRAHYIVDAPIPRVEAVLARNEVLMRLVRNEWVKLVVRDPMSGRYFEQRQGNYVKIESSTTQTHMSFDKHRSHGEQIAVSENNTYYAANVGTMAALISPIMMNYHMLGARTPTEWIHTDQLAANPRGALIALAATSLTLPTLAFARRYLHGEFMFGRFSALSVTLLLGFNLASTAPTLHHTLAGWSLFGFASTFLIGMYNDRPTVRQNAVFAFTNYRLSDAALLTAATFSAGHAAFPEHSLPYDIDSDFVVASGVCLAAFFKSSQWPLTQLLSRSMEGPTPSSAMGYGGLSAHIGVVFLANTMPLWYQFDVWRGILGAGGILTMGIAGLVAQIRSDRKGAVAYATSATLGGIYTLLAFGYSDLALTMCFGHAAHRMIQIFRASNIIADKEGYKAAYAAAGIDKVPLWPSEPSYFMYKLAWRFRRLDTDLNLLEWFDAFSKEARDHLQLTRAQQWAATGGIGVLVGAPWTPYMHAYEHTFEELCRADVRLAAGLGAAQFCISVVLMRFLLSRVQDPSRFVRATVFDDDGKKAERKIKFDKVDNLPLAMALTGTLLGAFMISRDMMTPHHCEEEKTAEHN